MSFGGGVIISFLVLRIQMLCNCLWLPPIFKFVLGVDVPSPSPNKRQYCLFFQWGGG